MAKKKIYRFNGTEGKSMDETLVKKWIRQHADHHETKGHFFGKEIIHKILSQRGCKGIRMYHAIDDNGKKQIILVGADEKGKDQWPSAGPKAKGKGAKGFLTGDESHPCPPFCT